MASVDFKVELDNLLKENSDVNRATVEFNKSDGTTFTPNSVNLYDNGQIYKTFNVIIEDGNVNFTEVKTAEAKEKMSGGKPKTPCKKPKLKNKRTRKHGKK